MRPAYKQKNPTISNVKSLDLWSEWRESNSRPLEPHSSALPKLRYTRTSDRACRSRLNQYTRRMVFCQALFSNFFFIFGNGRCAAHRLRKLHRSQRHSEHALRTGIQQSLRAGRGRGSGGQDIVHQKDALSLHSLRPWLRWKAADRLLSQDFPRVRP